MKQRKYTLPRHTNLAKQGSRIGAFLIDTAISAAITLAFFFGCFNLIFKGMTNSYRNEMTTEQLNSHLRIKVGDRITQPDPAVEDSYNTFSKVISYYYMNYLTGEGIDKSVASRTYEAPIKNDEGKFVPKKDYYTIAWLNRNVFGITVDDPDSTKSVIFTYQKDESGRYDKSKIAIPKSTDIVPTTDIHYYLQKQYLLAYDHFLHLDYVYSLSNNINFTYTLEFVLSAVIGTGVAYLLLPYIFKQGRTVGKKIFGLALAKRDGYEFANHQLFMRIMPLYVCLAAMLIPVWNDLLVVLLVVLIIFLVSFALAMASPLKASLHDLTARTIVVDDRTSIIFSNEMEEEAYLLKEDNLVPETSDGEEPELKYEK